MTLFHATCEAPRDVLDVRNDRQAKEIASVERTPLAAVKSAASEPVQTSPKSLPTRALDGKKVIEKSSTTTVPLAVRVSNSRRSAVRVRACRIGSLLARFDEESDTASAAGSVDDGSDGHSARESADERAPSSRKRPATSQEAVAEDAESLTPISNDSASTSNSRKPERDDDTVETLVIRKKWKRRLASTHQQTSNIPTSTPTPTPTGPTPMLVRSLSSQSMFHDRPKLALERPSSSATPSSVAEKLHELVLPTVRSSKHPDLNVISPDTVADLMNGTYADRLDAFVLVDCRFGYEHEGGHLKGARSMNDPAQVEDTFLLRPLPNGHRVALVFYCEFSANRAPKMLRHLRNLDRWIHAERYPELFYPELYLIDGGYKNCFETLKGAICDPAEYLPMNHPSFADQCKRDFATLRSQWRQHKTSSSAARFQQLHRHLSESSSKDDGVEDRHLRDLLELPPHPVTMRAFSQQL
ncbi:hypothetical protein PINS_up013577 [Pythium insidiosum]|nr:hypothetical protein PINS_up013577 [Pythium insidiosum]